MINIYEFLRNPKYTLREALQEIITFSDNMAYDGRSLNNLGYTILLQAAVNHKRSDESDLARKVDLFISNLKSPQALQYSPSGFKAELEKILIL